MKQVDLVEILRSRETYDKDHPTISIYDALEAMKEACRQILELAAENAKINWVENNVEMESDTDFSFRDNDGNWCKININEQSILDTKKQIV